MHIALVGKYTKLEDAYASVIKALNHAAMAANYRLRLTYIAAADLEDDTKSTGRGSVPWGPWGCLSQGLYTLRRPVMGEVLSTRIWGVIPAGGPLLQLPTAQAGRGNSYLRT